MYSGRISEHEEGELEGPWHDTLGHDKVHRGTAEQKTTALNKQRGSDLELDNYSIFQDGPAEIEQDSNVMTSTLRKKKVRWTILGRWSAHLKIFSQRRRTAPAGPAFCCRVL